MSRVPESARTRVSFDAVLTTAAVPLNLSSPPLRDWLALGTRSDLKQVRAKVSAPVISVDQPSTASIEIGAFRTSWTDGVPEQSHVSAADWLKVPDRNGLSISIAAANESRTVVLYAGARDLRATLSISGRGIAPSQKALGPVARRPQGLVITVSLPPTTGPTRLRLAGAGDGPSPQVYLAAATISADPS